jgi:anti-sigma regulatory factor (Ser/Thr protein kinase)
VTPTEPATGSPKREKIRPAAMSVVHVAFTPDPAYVRTVRLVAAAVARRAGVADELLDEVRLAIGEACSRAVALHRRLGLADPIDVTMTDRGRFTVRVIDRGPPESAQEPGETTLDIISQMRAVTGRSAEDEEVVAAGVGLALLTGLVSDLEVTGTPEGDGTEVRMSWPVQRRPGG